MRPCPLLRPAPLCTGQAGPGGTAGTHPPPGTHREESSLAAYGHTSTSRGKGAVPIGANKKMSRLNEHRQDPLPPLNPGPSGGAVRRP